MKLALDIGIGNNGKDIGNNDEERRSCRYLATLSECFGKGETNILSSLLTE